MIESLHSPHVARVKALLGSRGKKERKDTGHFVAEGLQFLREAIHPDSIPEIQTLYLSPVGRRKCAEEKFDIDDRIVVDVSEDVLMAMSEIVTPQGILAICKIPNRDITNLSISEVSRTAYMLEIQDPGNAGTILRTADATGFTECITSPNSVDFFSPKVVRASAGSLWHIPVYERIELHELIALWPNENIYALDAAGPVSLLDVKPTGASLWIFGNEAHGLASLSDYSKITRVNIPMAGNAESLNLASAAAIVMFRVTSAS